ncbi:hypothetical protein L596_026269 [Steinernema carpocapsae]|uniref:Uncharacterized protein n=1 Tax=Steinernema carpocapsae TaxID=34508 RepID=A0A4U5M0V1_STECR|nr:hypothetical protein L596_026269 [Steinernema carpocapsae]
MLPPRSALTCLSQYGICFSRFCFSVRSQVSHQFWLFWLLQLSFQLRARHFFRRSGSLKPQGTHLKMSEAASPPVKRGRGRPRKSNPDGEVPPPIVIPATQEGTKMRKKANRSGFTPTEIEDLPEKRIRKLKIKSFPNEDEDSEPRSAFSIPRRSDSTEPSSSKFQSTSAGYSDSRCMISRKKELARQGDGAMSGYRGAESFQADSSRTTGRFC